MINLFFARKGRLVGILLPVVLLISLMIAAPVFADSEPTSDPATVTSTESGTDSGNQPETEVTAVAESAEGTTETSLSENSEEQTEEETVDAVIPDSQDEEDSTPQVADDTTGSENEMVDSTDPVETELTEETIEISETSTDELNDVSKTIAENNLTVVDENGEALDMASESSAETISSADPWWLVGATKYAFIKTGGSCPSGTIAGTTCFESDTPISSALMYMDSNDLVPSDGILHIEADTYSEDITVDGASVYGNLSTLKGIVSSGSSSNTTITGTVTITNTTAGFTLIGMTIEGQLEISGNIGTITLTDVVVESSTGTGISITDQNGAVVVDQVAADDNSTYGMYIDNTAGSGAVTITNSEFNFNDDSNGSTNYSGLYIKSNGIVTLDGVSANGNGGNGVEITYAKNIVVKNSTFNNNSISSASELSGHGLYINNSHTTGTVTLSNVQVDNNAMSGFYVITRGNIVIDSVISYANGVSYDTYGALLNNTSGKGTITIVNSEFLSSGGTGLYVYSNSKVAMDGVTAEDNGGDGVYIDNCNLSGSTCLGNGIVSITGKQLNFFNDNAGYGLYILSASNVTLANFTANGNAKGVYIQNDFAGKTGKVTLNLTYTSDLEDFANTISGNDGVGLEIYSNSNISVEKVDIYDNGTDGAILDNDNAGISAPISVSSSNFYGNKAGDGLAISTIGKVTLYNVNAYQNSGNGVTIYASSGTGLINYTSSRSGTNTLTGNGAYGLYIESSGIVNLYNIDATGNGYGGYVRNNYGDSRAVNINNSNFSNSTIGTGLAVLSNGIITLNNVTSSSNQIGGIILDNSTANSAQKVVINRVVANENTTGSGMVIETLGLVSLSNITADSNAAYGVNIDNCQYDSGAGTCQSFAGVKLQGEGSEFNGNSYGLMITSAGSIVLTNLSADNNISGLVINNSYASNSSSVKISNSKGYINSFSNNDSYGIYIEIPGEITLGGIKASENGNTGVYLTNTSSTKFSDVTLINVTASGNSNDGVNIITLGDVMLKGVQTDENTNYGINVNNAAASSSGNVTAMPYTTGGEGLKSSGNGKQGLVINTNGNISLASIEISSNGTSGTIGAYLDNQGGGTAKSIVLKDATFDDNNKDGVVILSKGQITWTGGSASGNDSGTGATISNTSASIARTITISSVDFDENTTTGLSVTSLGNITLGGVTADNNGSDGVDLDNCVYSSSTGACTGTGKIVIQSSTINSFNGNGATGLVAYSSGDITVVNVEANENTMYGLNLRNNYTNAAGNISIKTGDKSTFNKVSGNDDNGVNILTNGSVLVSNVIVNENGSNGILVQNTGSADEDAVTINRIKTLTANNASSIVVTTKGEIKLSYVVDYGDGILLDNTASANGNGVTILRSKVEGVTGGTGLSVVTNGDVILDSMIANKNKIGVSIDNSTGGNATVKVLETYSENVFSNNTQTGLLIISNGGVSLAGITAEGNGGDGINVSTDGNLVVADATLYRNSGNGMNATASAGATIRFVNAANNGAASNGDGVYIKVASGSDVAISYSAISGNYGDGIAVSGDASPTLFKTSYFGNDINNTGDKNLNIF